jgi:proliferating cell nuclear antigen
MSQAESQSDSEDVQSNEASSGIVITNGPDGLGDAPDNSDATSDEAEEQSSSEATVSEPDESEASVEDAAGPDASTDLESENDPESAAAESTDDAESGENDQSESEIGEEPAVPDSDEVAEGEVTETDTEEESEPVVEADSSEPAQEPEVEETATEDTDTSDNTNENKTNMSESETETEADNTTQSATTDTGSTELSEVSGTPSRFEATIKVETLQGLIDSVDVLVDECKVRLSENRVGVRAVDPANVGMVDVDLEAEAFESYHTEPGILGLNLEKFADVVGLGSKGDLVHLNYDPQTRKLHISVDGVEYTLALIDPDSIRQEPDIPDLDLPVEVAVESSVIDQGVTAADMVSDHIALGTQQDGRINQFTIEAEGDTDDVELVKGEDEDEIIEGTFRSQAHSLFSLDYLKDMNKALPKNGVVTLELGEEFPVKIHFDDDDGEMTTTYMLAPRIQSD